MKNEYLDFKSEQIFILGGLVFICLVNIFHTLLWV